MSRSTEKTAASLPTASGVLCRLAAEHAAQAGIRIAPLLRKADLPLSLTNDESLRVTSKSQIVFLDLVANALQDPLLGFHLARDMDMRELAPLYYLMASSSKLGDALDNAARYSAVVNEAVRVSVARSAATFSIDYEYVGIERHLDRHQIVFWITYTLRAARALTNRALTPTYVGFVHQSEADNSEMERYFECPLKFGVPRDRISFDPQITELHFLTEDLFLNRFMVAYCNHASVQRARSENPIRTRVENAIVPRLSEGTASVGAVASDLGLSIRTLSRKLAAEGLTFSTILDELRFDLALQYLRNYELSISQIAWLLGYTEISSFVHAFQRWAGKSPTDARRSIRHS
ncbi:AraC family transcriptional regulator [Microvirga flavescens]|uniref:AraC family transcriptional regulator n=1 Tax=Microvirga flavescens TaxID=2249811 RepID=UPI0018E09F9E|nr:AraC family transcriptional regulator [Microvirga flavescens]